MHFIVLVALSCLRRRQRGGQDTRILILSNVNTHWRVPDITREVLEGDTKFLGFSWRSHEPAKLDINAVVISFAPTGPGVRGCPREFRLYRCLDSWECPGPSTLHWASSRTTFQKTNVVMVATGDGSCSSGGNR